MQIRIPTGKSNNPVDVPEEGIPTAFWFLLLVVVLLEVVERDADRRLSLLRPRALFLDSSNVHNGDDILIFFRIYLWFLVLV